MRKEGSDQPPLRCGNSSREGGHREGESDMETGRAFRQEVARGSESKGSSKGAASATAAERQEGNHQLA
jgi:hypothetical protein